MLARQRLLKEGRRETGEYFICVWQKSECFRWAILLPGWLKGAVRRNRLKRLVRETLRIHRTEQEPPVAVAVMLRRKLEELTFAQVESDLGGLLQRVNRAASRA